MISMAAFHHFQEISSGRPRTAGGRGQQKQRHSIQKEPGEEDRALFVPQRRRNETEETAAAEERRI